MLRVAWCLGFLFIAALSGFCQRLRGTVYDSTGATIAGARVTVTSKDKAETSAATASDGHFSLDLAPGNYHICVTSPGFTTPCRKVRLRRKQLPEIRFTLRIVAADDLASSSVMNNRLRILAGPRATDCGHVKVGQSPSLATQCVMRSFASRKPFFVRYDLAGIDSEVSGGLVGQSNGVLTIVFDSFGTSPDGLPSGSTFADDHYNIILPCPKPVALHITSTGKVSCFRGEMSNAGLIKADW